MPLIECENQAARERRNAISRKLRILPVQYFVLSMVLIIDWGVSMLSYAIKQGISCCEFLRNSFNTLI